MVRVWFNRFFCHPKTTAWPSHPAASGMTEEWSEKPSLEDANLRPSRLSNRQSNARNEYPLNRNKNKINERELLNQDFLGDRVCFMGTSHHFVAADFQTVVPHNHAGDAK